MTRSCRASLCAAVCLISSFALVGFAPAALAAPSAVPASSCTPKTYAYAGLFSNVAGTGVKATVTTLANAQVTDGHVAGWIGVGGTNAGPGGQAEWLQAGVDTMAGGGTEIYAETTLVGSSATYKTLVAQVDSGTPYKLAVLELPNQPDMWQVWLNGQPVTTPVSLPGSSKFQPMAMSESWNGGTPTCNGFAYRFDGLQIATGGAWHALTNTSTLSDIGYQVMDRTTGGFTAASSRS